MVLGLDKIFNGDGGTLERLHRSEVLLSVSAHMRRQSIFQLAFHHLVSRLRWGFGSRLNG
jgi:hypothetical protein